MSCSTKSLIKGNINLKIISLLQRQTLSCGLRCTSGDMLSSYELVFSLAVLFWYVVVACNVAGLGQTLSLAQECRHEAARFQRSEETDPLKEKYFQRNKNEIC